MKSIHIIGVVAVSMFALGLMFSPVQADVSLSGDLEIDTAYTSTTDESTDPSTDETIYDLGGRIKVVPAVRKEAGNLFMEVKAELLAKTDNTDGNGVQIDDAYGKIGTSVFDVQIGRYEAWNLHDESNDMLIAEAPNGVTRYEANYARGRIDSAGQLALHVLPSDAFGLELGLVYGQDSHNFDADRNGDGNTDDGDNISVNVVGFRPVILTKLGPVEFSVGADMLNITPQDDSEDADISKLGYGARVKATFGIVTLGINYASGTEENDTTPNADTTTQSMGGYCDLALGKGVLTLAGFLTNWEVDNSPYEKTHDQYYVAYAHPLPIDGAAIKFAVSQASATEETAGADIESDALAFKIRLNYDF